MKNPLPFRISVLIFLRDQEDRQLLLQRRKAPNLGCWSPIGGKLEMAQGESPFECAVREVREEADLELTAADLHLFAMVSEKNYEGSGHWLMFLFESRKRLEKLPPPMEEGRLGLFSRREIDELPIAETDRQALWPIYDRYREGFVSLRADTLPNGSLEVVLEEIQLEPEA